MNLEEAKTRAAEEAAARGWPWRGTVKARFARSWIVFGRLQIEVWSNADVRGASSRFVFDARTGEIEHAGFIPR